MRADSHRDGKILNKLIYGSLFLFLRDARNMLALLVALFRGVAFFTLRFRDNFEYTKRFDEANGEQKNYCHYLSCVQFSNMLSFSA